jgi:DegV family protein with EDD domain
MAERFAIVVDGTASIPDGMERDLEIRTLPLHVDIGNASYTAGVDLTAADFYRKIAAPDVKPGTSQPSMGECREVYESILRTGTKQILVLTVANELSGTYSVATTTAQQIDGARVEVVDTRSVAGGISLIATACSRVRREGGAFDEATALARRLAGNTHVLATTDTLEYLRRSGRVSGGAALFGSLLSVKPLLEVEDGVVRPIDKVRTRDKANARLKELIEEKIPPGTRINACTMHTNDPERAAIFADWVQGRFHCVEHWIAEAGAVIGARAGPGVIGLCWYRSEEMA